MSGIRHNHITYPHVAMLRQALLLLSVCFSLLAFSRPAHAVAPFWCALRAVRHPALVPNGRLLLSAPAAPAAPIPDVSIAGT